jgi:hypothetical protein
LGERGKYHVDEIDMGKSFGIALFFYLLSRIGLSQDVHYTQWWMSDGFVQPASIHSPHDVLLQAGMKSQWNGVSGVPFQLQNFHFTMPLSKWRRVSLQGSFLSDKSGDGSWVQNKWNAGAGYLLDLDSSKFSVNTVFLLRGGNSRWNNSAWQFMDDWNGLFYEADLGQKEFFDRSSAWGWAFSSVAQWNITSNVQAQLGFSHFSSMHYRLKDGTDSYAWASQQMIGSQLNVNTSVVHPMKFYSLFHQQSGQRAWLGFGEWGSVVDTRSWLMTTLWLGSGWRWNDALVLGTGCSWGGHLFRLTYDVNVSPFRVATEYRGGWELQYQFQFLSPKLDKKMKAVCPAYY